MFPSDLALLIVSSVLSRSAFASLWVHIARLVRVASHNIGLPKKTKRHELPLILWVVARLFFTKHRLCMYCACTLT